MQTKETGKANYYAFISHKSTDAQFALKLQKFIESYNLPTNIRKMANMQDRRLSPLCAYEVDFSANPLLDEMRGKLKRSRYLILLCSEELLKSGTKYVNYEIRTFIECKREEGIDPLTRIIPIIVTGEFGSPEHECCPEALQELGENCPIALDRKKYKTERELFLHVISALLDIDYTVIENRDKKRQRNRAMAAAGVFALLAAVGIGLGEYFIPQESCYQDFVMRNGLPEGIGKLSDSECKAMGGHYVITRRKHKIESLEYVDSYGNRIDHSGSIAKDDRPSAYRFAYTDSGLSSVTYEDRFGVPYFIMQYSGDSAESADLRDANDPAEAFYIGSGYESDLSMLLADVNISSRSDISRFRYAYSDEGHVTEVTFCADSTGRLAQDNSVYGFSYVLDEKGRITETYFLDALGERRLNSEGIFCRKYTYDDRNNLVEWVNYGRNGEPVPNSNGLIRCEFDYDDHHNLIRYTFTDGNGDPVSISYYGGAGHEQTWDDHGKLEVLRILGEDGTMSQLSERYTYDENGFTASRVFLNADGEPAMDTGKQYAEIRYVNDEAGNVLEVGYYDAQGKPVNNAWGFAREVREYDAMGRQLSSQYFDADGQAADYRGYGYSSEVISYDERGRETSRSYYGPEGQPVNTKGPIFDFGYHKLEAVYKYGAHTKQTLSYYDADGNLVNMHSSLGEEYARMELVVQNGEITYMANYCADGSVYGNIMESETDRTAQAEPFTTTRYVDGGGNVQQETVMYYSLSGVEKRQTQIQFGEDGAVTARREVLYHDSGERSKETLTEYAEDGTMITEYSLEYDKKGRKILEILTKPGNDAYQTYMVDSDYDEEGTLSGEIHTALRADGSIVLQSEITYDGNRKTENDAYFDESGKCFFREETVYDGDTTISKTEYDYNQNGSVIMVADYRYRPDGTIGGCEFLDYDDDGLLVASTLFVNNDDGTTKQTTTFYDENGSAVDVRERLLDENGDVIG